MKRTFLKRMAILIIAILVIQLGLINDVSAVYNGEPTYIKNIGGVDYEIKVFKSSGTFIVPSYVNKVDVTVVGGGGASASANGSGGKTSGAGGGYVKNQLNLDVTPGSSISVTIGAGGMGYSYQDEYEKGRSGGLSAFGSITANGGEGGGPRLDPWYPSKGGNGGSGGGGLAYGAGGIDGANGESDVVVGGTGQGTTTCGVDGVLYGKGGNGGSHVDGDRYGLPNTGEGASGVYVSYAEAASWGNCGGSGIVVVRWVANQSPTISIIAPITNRIYSDYDSSFIPQISVYDRNNNTLTCKYYIDTETIARETKTVSNTSTAQTVSFNAFDMGTLTEDGHTMKFEVSDGIASPVTQTVDFRVDKSAPTLGTVTVTSTITDITIAGSAIDNIAGLNPYPYRYTVSTKSPTDWLTDTSKPQDSLLANTQYTSTFEARDAVGHIAKKEQNIYTKAVVPTKVTVSNPTSYTLDVTIEDANPPTTPYLIMVAYVKANGIQCTEYVTPEGTLTASQVWIAPTNKTITVKGLSPETAYTFQAKAQNGDGVETEWSSSVSNTTLIAPPGAPANIVATATDNTITVSWNAVSTATSYEVDADSAEQPVSVGTGTTYTHTGLAAGTPHTYRIRGVNAGGPGSWSTQISKSTLPSKPGIPANLSAIPLTTSVAVTWDNVPGATGYDIMVDPDNPNDPNDSNNSDDIVNNGPQTNYKHTSLTPGTSHTYRVRSINAGDKSDWSSPITVTTLVESVTVPLNLNAVPSKNQIIVTWDAVDGATNYVIEVDGEGIDNKTGTSFTHINLNPGTEHRYRVMAKKGTTVSDWSTMIVVSTLTGGFGVPSNIKANVEDTSVSLSWEVVDDAVGYDVEIDGIVIDNGAETSCVHICIEKDSGSNVEHTYRVRARSATETSGWSDMLTVSTFELPTPKYINTTVTETSIHAVWEAVYGADSYDLEFDRTIMPDIPNAAYTFEGLAPGTQHSIRVRAKNTTGTSNWSLPVNASTASNGLNTPAISGIARKNSITLLWNSVNSSPAYDIEIDGSVTEGISGTTYLHNNLLPGTEHKYMVRTRDGSNTGGWSSLFTAVTLSETPGIPTNVTASSTMTSILVTWDKVSNAEEYEIKVDGMAVGNGTGTSYLHSGLSPDSTHTYSVRARNIGGYSGWSESISKTTVSSVQTYNIDCITGDEFNLLLSAANIQDLSNYSFTVRYNIEDFDVTDLCGLTSRIDASTGSITGTDIKVTQYEPGTIVFTKTGSAQTYEVWSGIVNSIKFKAKHDGQMTITYSIN